VSKLPPESEKLLGVAPNDFVTERDHLARELREAGRADDAAAVAALRKPSAVVFAVNRAARDRTKAARAAATAAARVEKAQAGGDQESFRTATRELDESLDLLSEVAVAHVAPSGKKPTDAMRKRVYDLLRRAVATKETREALGRGALLEEQEAAGFAAFEGMAATKPTSKRAGGAKATRANRREEGRRKREKALRDELKEAEQALGEATRAARDAERERTRAERAVASVRAKLDRLA
jgi:hypothetical protein